MLDLEGNYFIVHAMGKDRTGLIAMITKVIANAGFNIIDIEQSAPHGLFYIIMIIEPAENAVSKPLAYFKDRFEEISAGTDLSIYISPFKGGFRKTVKWWSRVIFVGPDKPGLIASLSDFMGKNNVNIHRLNMISRGEIIASEILLDISSLLDNETLHQQFNEKLKNLGESLGLQIIIQEEDVFKAKRKLLILDLDENLILIHGLLDFFKSVKIKQFTKKFLHDIENIQFNKQNQQKYIFAQYLKNLKIDTLKKIISFIRISPGTEELIRALKLMNYKIALISNSIIEFTDLLKKQLGIDYAFGNALEIVEDKLTGQFRKELIITPSKKQRLINWLASMEKIPDAEIYLFGLDEKESFLSHSAGLKISITFDFKGLKRMIESKECSVENLIAVIVTIGIKEEQFKKLQKFILSFK
ncbi:MAG: ACT domain-containing protein [Promethearchaeota archaeon]